MTTLTADSLATVVHLHIAELRREAADDRTARTARTAARAAGNVRRPWPAAVVQALRETFARPPATCPTC
jgi:hypothetical protein